MRISQGRRRACPRTRSRKRAGPGPPAPPLLQVGQHRQRNPAAGPEQRAPGQIRRVCLRQRPRLIGPQIPLAPPQRGGEIGQQPQRVPLTLRQGQEHLPGRRVREPGRKQRETALVAADDAELLTGEPGQPLPRNTAGLQQVNEPVPARARGEFLAHTPDEIRSGLARHASHASTRSPSRQQPAPAYKRRTPTTHGGNQVRHPCCLPDGYRSARSVWRQLSADRRPQNADRRLSCRAHEDAMAECDRPGRFWGVVQGCSVASLTPSATRTVPVTASRMRPTGERRSRSPILARATA